MQFIDLKKQYQILKNDIQANIDKVLEHGQYIMGPEVKEFENALRNFTGAKHVIAANSSCGLIYLRFKRPLSWVEGAVWSKEWTRYK